MPSLWQEADRARLLGRLAQLRPDTPARWGRFTCPEMLAHVNDAVRMATGELDVAPTRTPFRYPIIKQLVIYILPMPRGLPTATELLARVDAAEFEREQQEFPRQLERFIARSRSGPWPDHPAFGSMTGSAWGVLACRHIEHHFTQFGV